MNTSPLAESERTALFRDLAQVSQETLLLTNVLDAIATATSVGDVVQMIEYGINNVLPSTSWGDITLALRDESGQYLQIYRRAGAAGGRYWTNMRSGAVAASDDLGVQVEFVLGTAESQLTLLRAAIDQRVDAIAIAPIDAAALEPLVAEAMQANIPLIAFDSPPLPGSAVLAYIGTDNRAAGRLAGQALAQLLPAGGTVACSVDSLLAESAMERLMGAEEALAATTIQMLPPFEEGYDAEHGRELARTTLRDVEQLHGAFGAGGANGPNWGAAALEAGLVGQLKIVAFDLGADTIHMLKAGTIHAVVAQREATMAYRAVELLCRLLVEDRADTLASGTQIDTGADVVTLERTAWSVALADYLRRYSRPQPQPGLREKLRTRATPIKLRMIGMAEVGTHGVAERTVSFDRSSELGQIIVRGQSQLQSSAEGTNIAIPLLMRGETLGVLSLQSSMPNACSPDDLALLERVAAALAMAVENVRLFRQLDRRARELEDAARIQSAMLQTIAELSSPVVPVARGVLVVPMVGTIDSYRAAQFVETLLGAISAHNAHVVIIDITGVSVVDTNVAHHIVQAAQSAQLLGAEVVLVGITPAVAQTVVQLGVQLSGMTTRADLASGFTYALARTGGRLVYDKVTR
ncbi:MAG: substrate-binding domain-containing protein [Roseiflexaceae bacterium]|nr:substrate-binding domain-containing protein [Roseiflexaceae bacterium]